jgi:indolepyruvate ferredoxin oxidoreductase, beta subunit
MDPTLKQPICILIGALGGEGGGVLAQWIVDAAASAGFTAQSTSIPGVAQRTGATTYYVEVLPVPARSLSRAPVLSLYPVPGCVDLVVSSELLETGRMIANGFVSPDRTTLVTSTSRTLTTAEKIALGDGRFDSGRLLDTARAFSRRLVAFDMEQAAREAGTAMSAVMFGAIAGSGVLPWEHAVCEAVINEGERGARASLAGFALGIAAAQADAASRELPRETREIVALGRDRVVDFQDAAYGELYLDRIARIRAAEHASDPGASHDHALTREAARFLALWMAFDDVVRVATLKSSAARFARVRGEVGAHNGDVVRIYDHMRPGVPELAGLLPKAVAARLIAWDRRRPQPWSLPIKLHANAFTGFVLLRILAACKRLRRKGARYREEQAMIEEWLGAVERASREDWARGHELALCGRLVKGYGATNERGKRNLAHIVTHLATSDAAVIREAREAALADEGGKALDRALVAHGAPPRPAVAQPVRFVRRTHP